MSFAFQLKNFISISPVQVSWQTTLFYFIYWKCSYSTLKFEGYFCWIWNSKLTVLFCFTTFCSLDSSSPFHPWSSLFAVCPVLSLGKSLTGSSLHRLILVSSVSFHATERSLLAILSKTSLLLCDFLLFLFTSSVIFPQCLCLFPCFLSFYVNSSI